MLSIVHSL